MNVETLRIVRNMLLRSFVVGVTIALFYGAAAWLSWDVWMNLFTSHWHLLDVQSLKLITVSWFAFLRLVLVFGFLVPALAIHWTIKREQGLGRPR